MARQKMKEGAYYCMRCKSRSEMKLGVLPAYEYEEGIPLHNVPAYFCPSCKNFTFTEEQAHAMRDRTNEINEYRFGFERKVTVSGGSLVVGIPSELADHLSLKQGQKVRVIPVAKDGFMVRKMAA